MIMGEPQFCLFFEITQYLFGFVHINIKAIVIAPLKKNWHLVQKVYIGVTFAIQKANNGSTKERTGHTPGSSYIGVLN